MPVPSQWPGILLIAGIGVLVGLLYLPLLHWLGAMTLRTGQLTNGALLVMFAMVICTRQTVGSLQFKPKATDWGFGLLGVAMLLLWLAGRSNFWLLPLVLLSFCLFFAGMISFLFGKAGIRQFLPALGAFFVFGLLAGMVPQLDWPLRATAARYTGSVLNQLGFSTQIGLVPGQPPQLILFTSQRKFLVATECNGFGLLTSTLLVATILMFQFRLPWVNKLGLLVLAVPLSITCNFLRIVSICLVAPRTSIPYMVVHETLGVIFYYLGLVLIWWLANRVRPRQVKPRAESPMAADPVRPGS